MNFFHRWMQQHTPIRQTSFSTKPEEAIIEIVTGTYRLPRNNQQLSVLAGRAWVTLDDQDIIVGAGEQTVVPIGKWSALISSVDGSPLRFSLC